MNTALTLQNLRIDIAQSSIINDISFSLQTGELACLLGATGSGKSTILKAIAGFIQPKEGEIYIGDLLVSSHKKLYPAHKRQVSIVFQENTLLPHLTVEDNIAYGIKNLTASNRASRIDKLLRMTHLVHKKYSYPHELSGGENQRAAIARAMAPSPRIILLDEPFSNQDGELREELAFEVRQLLKHEQITALMVTHDQTECFALADTTGLIHNGKLLQWDSPYIMYHRPKTRYVAEFIGKGSILKGVISNKNAVVTALGKIKGQIDSKFSLKQSVEVFLRPEDVEFSLSSRKKSRVVGKRFRGTNFLYAFETVNTLERFYCYISSHYNFEIGDLVGLVLNVDDIILFPDYNEHL